MFLVETAPHAFDIYLLKDNFFYFIAKIVPHSFTFVTETGSTFFSLSFVEKQMLDRLLTYYDWKVRPSDKRNYILNKADSFPMNVNLTATFLYLQVTEEVRYHSRQKVQQVCVHVRQILTHKLSKLFLFFLFSMSFCIEYFQSSFTNGMKKLLSWKMFCKTSRKYFCPPLGR